LAWSGLKLKPSQANKKSNKAKPNHIGLKVQTEPSQAKPSSRWN